MDVLIPGGATTGFRQDVPGAPKLVQGREYLLFLWTAKSGATYITGLSQGVFGLPSNASNELMAVRPAISETVLDPKTWLPVNDEGIQMLYADMTSRITATLAQGGNR